MDSKPNIKTTKDVPLKTICPNCGGLLLGDGFTTVIHCENADSFGVEPDAEIVLCPQNDNHP